jgi:hypothetical protein
MHREEADQLVACVECGARIAPGTGRGYGFGESLLCFSCAIARGGLYDADEDRWTVDPQVADLMNREGPPR